VQITGSDMALDAEPNLRRHSDAETADNNSPLVPLLDGTIRLRELYRHARRRTDGGDLAHLRMMLETHYKEQVRLVDVLIDRARMSSPADPILAGTLMQEPRLLWDPTSRHARLQMLHHLLDAHERVLSAALLVGSETRDEAWRRDFAVGQVVLANEQQRRAICELLGDRCENPCMSIQLQRTSD
jgi:hypothetical protein